MEEPRRSVRSLRPLRRAEPQGWVRWAFWFLRGYIVLMLAVVALGLIRGTL